MRRALVILATVMLAACTTASTSARVAGVRELAGAWQGRLAMRLANAATTLTIKEDGSYTGALHFQGGVDQAISGTIVMPRPGRLRYHGTNGDGTVLANETTLRFMPDGGGGGGSFTRAR